MESVLSSKITFIIQFSLLPECKVGESIDVFIFCFSVSIFYSGVWFELFAQTLFPFIHNKNKKLSMATEHIQTEKASGLCLEIVRILVGGEFLSSLPVNHSTISQSRVCVSSCMRKRAESAFLWAPWRSTSSSLIRCCNLRHMSLRKHVLAVNHYPPWTLAVI